MTAQGIETRAGGQLFRSRLEARWAMFFDAIGWRWTYEPYDGDYYIPDFLIHGSKPFLVEVKPYATLEQCAVEHARVAHRVPDDLLVVGLDPNLAPMISGDIGVGFWTDDQGHPDTAVWQRCLDCMNLSIRSDEQSYMSRPCGHHDGDSYCGNYAGLSAEAQLAAFWRTAGDAVRWEVQQQHEHDVLSQLLEPR